MLLGRQRVKVAPKRGLSAQTRLGTPKTLKTSYTYEKVWLVGFWSKKNELERKERLGAFGQLRTSKKCRTRMQCESDICDIILLFQKIKSSKKSLRVLQT